MIDISIHNLPIRKICRVYLSLVVEMQTQHEVRHCYQVDIVLDPPFDLHSVNLLV